MDFILICTVSSSFFWLWYSNSFTRFSNIWCSRINGR